MECFLRVAEANTKRSLETCGVLAGTLVRTLLIGNGNGSLAEFLTVVVFSCRKKELFM
jgi:hypothetical protein